MNQKPSLKRLRETGARHFKNAWHLQAAGIASILLVLWGAFCNAGEQKQAVLKCAWPEPVARVVITLEFPAAPMLIVQSGGTVCCTLLRAVFKAGSFTRFAKKDKVRLIRYGQAGTREVTVVDVERIVDEGFLDEDVELQAGDMIIVDEKRINF